MDHGQNTNGRKYQRAGFGLLAAAVLVWGGVGCSNWNLRGDRFKDQNPSEPIRMSHPNPRTSDFWGFSNKAREIEADCGAE